MHFTFKQAHGYLRAELFGRQTVEETLEALAKSKSIGYRAPGATPLGER